MRAPGPGRYAFQVEQRTGAGGGEGRAEPFEVSLGPAEAAEEWEAVVHSLSGDESDQRVVDAPRLHADLHDRRGFSTLVRVKSVFRRRSDDGGGERRGTALPVRTST